MTEQTKDNFFTEENKAQSSWMKFEKVGDSVKGTLVGRGRKEAFGNFPAQEVFELQQEDGEIINVGVDVKKSYVINRMKNVKLGQICGLKFEKEVPSKTKGHAPAKSIEVYAGGMDESYVPPVVADVPVEEIHF